MRIPVIVLAFAAACAGDSPPATGRCTGLIYDPCNTEDNCDSALCQNFVDEFQVCSQMCDDTLPCPAGGDCNEFGVCKPPAANACVL